MHLLITVLLPPCVATLYGEQAHSFILLIQPPFVLLGTSSNSSRGACNSMEHVCVSANRRVNSTWETWVNIHPYVDPGTT